MALQDRHLLTRILAYENNIRRDMRANAARVKALAQAETRSVAELRDVHCIENARAYIRLVDRINGLPAEAKAAAAALLTSAERAELTASLQAMRQAAVALRDARLTTHAEVSSACDAVLSAIAANVGLD